MLLRLPVFQKPPYISSLISWGSTHHLGCLKPGSPRSRNEIRMWVQVIHLQGSDVRERGRQGGKEASTGSVNKQATAVGTWGSVLLGTSGRWQRTRCTGGTPEGLFSISVLHWLRTVPGAIHSKLHLGQGMTEPTVGGWQDFAEAWHRLLGRMGRPPQHLLQWNGQSRTRSMPFVAEGPGNFHSKNSRQGTWPNIKMCCPIYPGE